MLNLVLIIFDRIPKNEGGIHTDISDQNNYAQYQYAYEVKSTEHALIGILVNAIIIICFFVFKFF